MNASALVPLSRLRGQEAAVQALRQLVASGEPIPPLLIHGPEGTGKRTASLALAAALVCRDRSGTDACGRCPACRRVAEAEAVTGLRARAAAHESPRTYPDAGLVSIAGRKTRISALQARDIAQSLATMPFELSHRIYIIDPAHRMTATAANSLLKTLEEPPAYAALILVTSAPWNLPITIRSRLRSIRFRPLAEDLVRQLLEAEGVEPDEAAARSRRAGGSLTIARERDLEDEQQAIDQWAEIMARIDDPLDAAALAVIASETLASSPERAVAALDLLLGIVRDIAGSQIGRTAQILSAEQLERLARRPDRLLGPGDSFPRIIDRLRREIEVYNRNPRLAVEGAVLAAAGILGRGDLINES